MKIDRYQVYKDSDIEWIGDVPEHWKVHQFKNIAFYQEGPGLRNWQFTDEGIKVISVTNITPPTINFDKLKKYISPEEYHQSYKHFTVQKGDLLLASSGASWGKLSTYNLDEKVILNTSTIRIRSSREIRISTNFIRWILQSGYIYDSLIILLTGSCQPNFGPTHLSRLYVTFPPSCEQKSIAHYLDTKTAQIDRKIDLLTQKATKYGQLKQSIVNEAVTRGLDRSVVMKDSGIEWIGDVPEHWEVIRLKDVADQSKEKNGTNPVGKMLSVSGYRGIEIKQYDDELKKRTDDELLDYRVVRVGQLVVNTMWLNYRGIGVSKYRGYVSPAYRAYFVNKSIHGAFIHYLMRSDLYVSGYSKYLQGIRPNSLQMKTIDFECLPLPIPPLSEQKTIADYLDTKTTQIDQILQTINTQIEKLKELRKTLINDVVTGKIKVV